MKAFVVVPLGLAFAALVDVQSPITLREDRIVSVGSVQEHWLLEWRTRPEPACSPQSPEWFTCPCQGFAFGEMGVLDLVRRRPGHSDETLPLTPLCAEGENPATQRSVNAAVLQRWPVLSSDKIGDHSAAFEQQVRTRPVARALQFGDYDHDGRATEFMLLVGSTPCGHNAAVVVGISGKQPTLHFDQHAHPGLPLTPRPPSGTRSFTRRGSSMHLRFAAATTARKSRPMSG